MHTGAWRTLSLLALLGTSSMVGCSSGPRLAEVTGTVRLNGKPLPDVMVEFNPDAATGVRSTGATDENGRFTLVCDDQRPGAIVGTHRVVLHDLAIYGGKFLGRKLEQAGTRGGPTLKPSRIPTQYESTAHTPLKKEVKPEPQIIDLDVLQDHVRPFSKGSIILPSRKIAMGRPVIDITS
jgi:hypothetical protein